MLERIENLTDEVIEDFMGMLRIPVLAPELEGKGEGRATHPSTFWRNKVFWYYPNLYRKMIHQKIVPCP